MEWEEIVLLVASVLAAVIVIYLIWTGLSTVEVPR